MRIKIISLALITMVGSPALAIGEPTSLYLVAARKAEKYSNHRTAIFCLSSVLIDLLEKRQRAQGLSQKQLVAELTGEFNKAQLSSKALKLSTLSRPELLHFLELEVYASDPGKELEVFSDGSFEIIQKKWSNPVPNRFICCGGVYSNRISKDDPAYAEQLAQFWWFKMPPPEVLATKPGFVPEKPRDKTEPDGAFKQSK